MNHSYSRKTHAINWRDYTARDLPALEKARHFALTGNEQKGIPLKIWFDDPDWRPKGWQGTWLK